MIGDVVVTEAGTKGLGVYARRAFAVGDFVFRRRHVRVLTEDQLEDLADWERVHLCVLDVDRYAVLGPPGCYLNHSCEPNAMRHGVKVFAWRPIAAGDEITIDYRVNAFGGSAWRCECRTPSCTGVVAGGFFAMDPACQREYLPHAPVFIRREYRRRAATRNSADVPTTGTPTVD